MTRTACTFWSWFSLGRLQFTTAQLLLAMAAIGVVVAMHAATRGVITQLVIPRSYSGMAALLLFGLCCGYVRVRRDAEVALLIALVAWNLAMIDTIHRLVASFATINGQTPHPIELLHKYGLLLAGISLPVLCSIPAMTSIVGCIRKPISRPTVWFTTAAMLGFFDIVFITLCTVAVFGARHGSDGTLVWPFDFRY